MTTTELYDNTDEEMDILAKLLALRSAIVAGAPVDELEDKAKRVFESAKNAGLRKSSIDLGGGYFFYCPDLSLNKNAEFGPLNFGVVAEVGFPVEFYGGLN